MLTSSVKSSKSILNSCNSFVSTIKSVFSTVSFVDSSRLSVFTPFFSKIVVSDSISFMLGSLDTTAISNV